MVHWSSLAYIALVVPLVQAIAVEQQSILAQQKLHSHKDALDRAHTLLRHNQLIDTHNDLPM
jgi:hypothetical protein